MTRIMSEQEKRARRAEARIAREAKALVQQGAAKDQARALARQREGQRAMQGICRSFRALARAVAD